MPHELWVRRREEYIAAHGRAPPWGMTEEDHIKSNRQRELDIAEAKVKRRERYLRDKAQRASFLSAL
jgi:hypothetical protein